jgi:CheY-like chemotaxis protein
MANQLKYEVISLDQVPFSDATISRSFSAPRPASRPESGGAVVLVVDDERIIADTLSMILSKSGYHVLTAYDGKSALELARGMPPALLITDVVMPGMTGIELAMSMVKIFTDCRVLLFSGQAATLDLLKKAREMGHDFNILSKPVHPTDMLRRVSECFEAEEMLAQS